MTQKDPILNPESQNLFRVGVIGKFQEDKSNDKISKIIFEPRERVKINKFVKDNPYFVVSFSQIRHEKKLNEAATAIKNNLIENINKLISIGKPIPVEILVRLISSTDPNDIVDSIMPFTESSIEEKQKVLESEDIYERLELANEIVAKTVKISELEKKVAQETTDELSKAQKEIFLREEMKTIQKELGEEGGNEIEDLRKKVVNSGMPKESQDIAFKELSRLQKTSSFSPEVSYIRNYLDWLINLPWDKESPSEIDLAKSRQILDDDHFGLEKVKERIIEYLAVQKLTGQIKGPILCFVGPPGTGKTSIGKSIARSMNRKFTRVSLGGVHDEAEIRGHRRTYVGAMPGRIIQSINQVEVKNPVFMLDEIDKIGRDFRGDPTSSLLEVLDPEQNSRFSDHYLEVAFDLSDVMFITTANTLETIPKPLLDRMEIIEFPGYTPEEKMEIAKKFIIPKVLESHGLKNVNFKITDGAVLAVVNDYTQEAGVRNLEREIAKISRKIALLYAQGFDYPREINLKNIPDFLGVSKVERFAKETKKRVGMGVGLAVTEAGGEVIFVEAAVVPNGRGDLILTGNMGDIMKESAKTALSYVRSIAPQYHINPEIFIKSDLHLHIPRGAVPKDGPSAGGIIALTILSAVIGEPIDNSFGMTGEITLQGNLLRVGGIKEKILAAKRFGLQKIIIPSANEQDLREIPGRNMIGLDFTFADSMTTVLPMIFKKYE